MKKLIYILPLLFLSFISFSQVFVPRGSSAITNVDSRLKAGLNFYLPWATDTTLNGGLDSLGALLLVIKTGDTSLYMRIPRAGGNKWVKMLRNGDPAGGVLSFNTRTGNVTLNSSDITTALGYIPPNPNGTNLQYIAGDGSKVTFPTIPAQFNPLQGYGITITGTYPNKTFTADTSTLFPALRATLSGSGILSLNGLAGSTQTFATASSGTDFSISSSGSTHTFSLPSVGPSARGLVTSSLYNTWNNKLGSALSPTHIFVGNGSNAATDVAMSGDATINSSGAVSLASIITAGSCTSCNISYDAKGRITVASNGGGGGGGDSAVLAGYGITKNVVGTTITLTADSATLANYFLRRKDSTLYATVTALATKQPTGNYITALAGDVGATGPGSATATIQPSAVTTAKINNNAVTYGKMQPASGQALLGATGAGNFQEITLGTNLSMTGSVLNAAGGGGGSDSAVVAGVGLTKSVSTTTITMKLDTSYNDNRIQKIYNVKTFGATGDGREFFDGAINSSSFTLTSATASFLAGDVGKVIVVDSAGGAGKPLITTIASFTNSTTIVLTASATATVTAMRFVYGTDQTTFVQAAINACINGGGGKVWIPNGLYIIAGALQTSVGGTNPNSQLYIPSPITSRDTNRTAITIEGETAPNFIPNSPFAATSYWPGKKGTVLLSTINGSGTAAAMIGGKSSLGYQNFLYSTVIFKNLSLLTQINPSGNGPTVGGINGITMSQVILENIFVSVDGLVFNEPLPTADCAGIAMPILNSEAMNSAKNVQVVGYRYGFAVSEHCSMDNVQPVVCYGGLVGLNNNHASSGIRIEPFWCKYALYIPNITILGVIPQGGFFFNMSFPQFDLENTSVGKWYDGVHTICDSGNLGKGYVFTRNANNDFSVVGASNIKYNPNENIYSVQQPTQVDIAAGSSGTQPFSITSSSTSRTGMNIWNSTNGGQSLFTMNDQANTGLSGYLGMIYGNTSNAVGNLFGVSRANTAFVFSDGANNQALAVGTLVNKPFILGANNTEILRITGTNALFSSNVNITKNQNSGTGLTISNSNVGATANSNLTLVGDASTFLLQTTSANYAGSGSIGANNAVIYTDNADRMILTTQKTNTDIVMAPGSSSLGTAAFKSNGNVTIGSITDAGTGILQVTGTEAISSAGGAGTGLKITATAAANYATASFVNDQGGAGFQMGLYGSTGGIPNSAFFFNNITGGSFIMGTQGAEGMRINPSNELLIGSSTDQGAFTLQNTGGFYQSGAVKMNLGSDATGDIYYRNSGGNLTRLGIGGAQQHLLGGTMPHWGDTATSGGLDTLKAVNGGSGLNSIYLLGTDTLVSKTLKADNGLTLVTDPDSTNHIKWNGALNQDVNITAASTYGIIFGYAGSRVNNFAVSSSALIGLDGMLSYAHHTATDANYTVGAASSYIVLPTITADRTLTTSNVTTNGYVSIENQNSTGFNWTFANTVTDMNGNTVTQVPDAAVTVLYGNGTNVIIYSVSNIVNIASSAGTLTLKSESANYSFSGTTATWTLPALTNTKGVIYRIKNRGSGSITLNTNASGNDIYDTSAVNTITIAAGASKTIRQDGTFFVVQ